MCGILLVASNSKFNAEKLELDTSLKVQIQKRGPDSIKTHQISTETLFMEFTASVLHLRGESMCVQPIITNNSKGVPTVLCFNGEIYEYDNLKVSGNDTNFISQKLAHCDDVFDCLSKIRGEFSIIYLVGTKLYFARDPLGRRSLVWHKKQSEMDWLVISSVAAAGTLMDNYWEEVPANGLYTIETSDLFHLELSPWNIAQQRIITTLNTFVVSDASEAICPTHVNSLHRHLAQSVEQRCDIPANDLYPRLGILFSGGLDCMVLAGLANSYICKTEAIDLINVAFENPRTLSLSAGSDTFDVPDRRTAVQGVQELEELYPNRRWNFVDVNVTYAESLLYTRQICTLMVPANSVMDQSIAMAFWFASRASGKSKQSKAKVLLSGVGADEQLGGYSRHAAAYSRGGWTELVREMQIDVTRISSRNLGRDDRIVGSHGKEVRFPYLAEDVVTYLSNLPINIKTQPGLDTRGKGDKLLLRQLAKKMGMFRASAEPKRAIQFGARSAKMVDGKAKGHHIF